MDRQELKNLIVNKVALSGNKKPIIDTTINVLLSEIKLYAQELNDIKLISFVEKLEVMYF